jgi:hypothetical protein
MAMARRCLKFAEGLTMVQASNRALAPMCATDHLHSATRTVTQGRRTAWPLRLRHWRHSPAHQQHLPRGLQPRLPGAARDVARRTVGSRA